MPGLRTLTRIVGADLEVTFNISEESVADLSKHRYLKTQAIASFADTKTTAGARRANRQSAVQWSDRWEILRKYYLAFPFRVLRNLSRRIRKPITS